MAFIAGQYLPTISAASIGQTAGGITIEHFVNKRLITGDNQGLTPQDAVFQGHEVFAQMTVIEADNALIRDLMWPYDTTNEGRQGTVGRLDVVHSITKAIVLTAVSGTPAAGNPQTITMHRAVLAEGFPVSILYAPDLREITLRFRLYQEASNGDFWTPVYS